jgi:hypothetical protein
LVIFFLTEMSTQATNSSEAVGSSAPQEKSPVSTVDMYEIVSTIGKGSFGTVSKIRRKADGRVSTLNTTVERKG